MIYFVLNSLCSEEFSMSIGDKRCTSSFHLPICLKLNRLKNYIRCSINLKAIGWEFFRGNKVVYDMECILRASIEKFITCYIYINIQSDNYHQTNSEVASLKSNEWGNIWNCNEIKSILDIGYKIAAINLGFFNFPLSHVFPLWPWKWI